ncbi:MAG: hypothetical protein Q8N04_03070 [Nitrospira sp.]|nr:hypothetical protein [Nitrospira sp.]
MKPARNITPEDLRALVARSGVPAYVLGGRARVNPIQLSRLMRGHDPLTPEIVRRILDAIRQEALANGR